MIKKLTLKQFEKIQQEHAAEREIWAFLIGEMVLIFSEIEHMALLTIERASPSISDFATSLLLEKRVELLTQILEPHPDIDINIRTKFVETLRDAQKLSATRNLIVHNPVLLTFSPDPDAPKFGAEGRITSARNPNKDINLTEMREFLHKAEACRAQLNFLYSKAAYQLRFPIGKQKRRRRGTTNAGQD